MSVLKYKDPQTGEWKAAASVKLVEKVGGDGLDTAVAEYPQINDRVLAYLNAAEAAYTNDNVTVTVMPDYESYEYYDTPLGHGVPAGSGMGFYLQNESDGKGWAEDAVSSTYTIYNAVPNQVSQYLVKGKDGTLVSNGRVKPTGALRMLRFLWDARNSRDLGGWACDGGTVGYGKLFRGAVVNNDTYQPQNAVIASHIGIKHEIDFRGDSEAGYQTESYFGSDVRYKRLTLDNYYSDIINLASSDAANVRQVFRDIFDNIAHGEPTYYHCSLGRDRCGTVTFMLLALLGVDRKHIDMDYELSSFSSLSAWENKLLSAYRTRTDYQRMGTYLASLGGSTLRDHAVMWFLRSGFSMDEINAFRKAMVDGTPEVLDIDDFANTCTVTQNLTQCTSSNSATFAIEGEAYSAVITPAVGYEIDSITVTMGGQTVATVNNLDGTVSIEIDSVTGDIVITAACVKKLVYPPTSDAWTNRVLEAKTAVGGTEIYNTVGYMDGKYVSGNGAFGTDAATTATGFIPYSMTSTSAPVIYIKGITLDTSVNSHCRIYFSSANKEADNNFVISAYGTLEVLGEKYYKLTLNKGSDGVIDAYTNFGAFVAFRVSGVGSGEDLIVTLDEPIEETNGGDEDVTVPVSTILSHCDIDNTASTVAYGSSYRAVITPYDGYVIGSLSVTMGSVDITSTAVSGSVIYIESVTGKVDIMAVGVPNTAAYTNWLDADKAGYTNGKRLSSSGTETDANGYALSGYIPCKAGDVIRFAGITGLNASDSDANNHRVSFYDASKAHLRQLNASSSALGSASSASGPYYQPAYDSDGDLIEFTIPSADNTTNLSTVAYFRFCTANGGITDASVVTVNEVIE